MGEIKGGIVVDFVERFLRDCGLYEETLQRSKKAGMSLEDYFVAVLKRALDENEKSDKC